MAGTEKGGEEEGQRVESVCGREERKTNTGTTLKYTSFSLLTVEYCHIHRLGSGEFKCHPSTRNPMPYGPGSLNSQKRKPKCEFSGTLHSMCSGCNLKLAHFFTS